MKKPIKPNKPVKPSEPKDTISIPSGGSEYVYDGMPIRDILNIEGINIETACIKISRGWDNDGDDVDVVWTNEKQIIPNPRYKKEMKKYQSQLDKYNIKLEEWKTANKEYIEQEKLYQEYIKQQEIENAKKVLNKYNLL